jgi:hypothetical protein
MWNGLQKGMRQLAELVEQLLGFAEVAMRGVEGHSRDGKEREDQGERDGSAYPIASRLWVVAFFRILCWSPWKNGWLLYVDIEKIAGGGLAPHKKRAPRGAFWENCGCE